MVVMDEVHMMISEEAVLVTAVASEWAEAVAALEWPEVAASEWAEVLALAEWEVIYFCLILNILLFARKKTNSVIKIITFLGAGPSGATSHVVHMRGLPFRVTENDISEWFSSVVDPVSIDIQFNNQGRPTGEADVYFET